MQKVQRWEIATCPTDQEGCAAELLAQGYEPFAATPETAERPAMLFFKRIVQLSFVTKNVGPCERRYLHD